MSGAFRVIEGGRSTSRRPVCSSSARPRSRRWPAGSALGRSPGRCRAARRRGRRRARRTGRAGRRRAGRGGSPRSARARPSRRALVADGLPLGRFARLDARGGSVTPGLVDPHTHLLFAGTREDELVLRQRGAGYLEILGRRRRDPLDGRRDPGRRPATTCSPTAGAGSTRCSATASRRSRRSPATAWTSRPRSGCWRSPTELGREGPIDVVPTFLGAHAVAPEFRARPDGTEAYVRSVIDEQLPGVAAHGRARFCDVFCEEGVFSADQSRRILIAARATGWRPAPCGRARPVRWRGARGRARRRLGRPPRDAVGRRASTALAGGRGGRASGRRDAPAGHDVVPHEGPSRPGADVHRPGRARRHRDRLQPRDLADGEPAAGDDGRLPRAAHDARRGAGGGHDQRRAGAAASTTRSGRSSRARRPTSSSGGSRRPRRSRTGRRADLVRTVVKRGGSSSTGPDRRGLRRTASPRT